MDFAAWGAPLTEQDLDRAVALTGCEAAALWTLVTVEASGVGFLADRRPRLLFERHYFCRLTGGRFDALDPDISAPAAGGYGPGGSHQYDRLQAALVLDPAAALRSASWGLGQVMGAAFASAGYADVEAMVADCVTGEGGQLRCLARFLVHTGLATALRDRNWTRLARGYNGPDFAAQHYDERLAASHRRLLEEGLPDLAVRAAQLGLTYQARPVSVDGRMGPATQAALGAFQAEVGLAVTRAPDTPRWCACSRRPRGRHARSSPRQRGGPDRSPVVPVARALCGCLR